MDTHAIHSELLRRRVRVLVVGCGGTGSAIAAGLPYLHQAMMASGHPGGLQVTVMDGDTISPTNCVRQPFSRSELGLYKVVVLVSCLINMLDKCGHPAMLFACPQDAPRSPWF
jgi:molybdopterin/thiamine biosynthesis adenylyltransferase